MARRDDQMDTERKKRGKDWGGKRDKPKGRKHEAGRREEKNEVRFEECWRSQFCWFGLQKFRNPYPDLSLCLQFFTVLILKNSSVQILNLSPFRVKDSFENLAVVLDPLLEKYIYSHKIFPAVSGVHGSC